MEHYENVEVRAKTANNFVCLEYKLHMPVVGIEAKQVDRDRKIWVLYS